MPVHIGREEKVFVARPADHFVQAGLVNGEVVRLPGGDPLFVDIDDDEAVLGTVAGDDRDGRPANITGSNAFFVREDLVGNSFCANKSAEYLYNPPRYWLTFDGFAHIGHPPDFGPYTDLIGTESSRQ